MERKMIMVYVLGHPDYTTTKTHAESHRSAIGCEWNRYTRKKKKTGAQSERQGGSSSVIIS